MSFTPSPQQAAFYDWIDNGEGSCVLEAVAGSGKTTTLIEGVDRMIGNVFFGAYNKAIADEIGARIVGRPSVTVSTMHAAGFKAWRRIAKSVRVDGDKLRNIIGHLDVPYDYRAIVQNLVSLAKQAGVGFLLPATSGVFDDLIDHFNLEIPPGGDLAKVVGFVDAVLKMSQDMEHEVIDFDDMIYTPLARGAKFWQYDWVLIDEAQDTNATRREMALRMLRPGGRLVAVGDSRQAIYGFTGADSNALDLIAEATGAVRMPLTVTYRCPKSVVAFAQKWVSHIKAADEAPEGEVIHDVPVKQLQANAAPGDAVLCRFTAPLVSNVYAMIAAGIPARIEGREIEAGLKKLATRWKTDSLAKLEDLLQRHLDSETAKLTAKKKERLAEALKDKVECLAVLIARTCARLGAQATVGALVGEIESLFGAPGSPRQLVTFSTIHRSKGREWDRVLWITTGPSKYARQPWELVQEDNLCYVAATRAKKQLVLLA